MPTVHLIDVSAHQDPAKFDWPALVARGDVRAAIARASYGRGMADRDFKKFCEQIRAHGLHFGAYLFYRQIHTVRDQLSLFDRQLELAGGLMMGDLFPTLDMEHNAQNGDGEPRAAQFSDDCRQIAEVMRAQYGGCILYYSSYFPSYLRSAPGGTKWMKEPGYLHWLADYGDKTHPQTPGKPRTPYTLEWHIHQFTGKGRLPEYAEASEDLDLNVINPTVAMSDLLIGNLPELDEGAQELEEAVNARRGGAG